VNQQLSLFPESKTRLDLLIEWSFEVFDSLDPSQDYQLAFSGGKDSHVLLGVYLLWCESSGKRLNLKVVFSDTLLESPGLLALVGAAAQLCDQLDIPFVKVQPSLEKNFWVLMIGRGYVVPNHKARWCTGKLKVEPMNQFKSVPIAGSHKGESSKRNERLDGCGSSECGIDFLENKVEPLTPWRNCDVWDWIILQSDDVLYQGVSDSLLSLYDISESQNGSLRMGCFMCPVVGRAAIAKQVDDGIIPDFSLAVRDLIEELRVAPRILSERTGKAGAIRWKERNEFWQNLQPLIPRLREYGWLSEEVEQLVNELLKRRAYPPTYRQEWIDEQEAYATPWRQRKGKVTISSKYEQLALL
jgi:3'-phosphoadenosine 5'-phosphosulfate sulfotransferase (PAPS reductase)/FAD synthetase